VGIAKLFRKGHKASIIVNMNPSFNTFLALVFGVLVILVAWTTFYATPQGTSSAQNGPYDHDQRHRLTQAASSDFVLTRVKKNDLDKIGTMLGNMVEALEKTNSMVEPATALSSQSSADRSRNTVLVDVTGTDGEILKIILDSYGCKRTGCYGNSCSAYAPVDRLVAIAGSDVVLELHPALPKTNSGSIVTEGDRAMDADDARTQFGVSGEGILVGILSDSYNCLGGAAGDISSKDLPGGQNDIVILQDLEGDECASAKDEGRAMMQIIHDVAPGARLAYRTAFRGTSDFASGIRELAQAGCDIIVDDIGYLTEPFFQDGDIAQAADEVVAQGIPFFSSSGNYNEWTWDDPNGFRSSGQTFTDGESSGDRHLFDGAVASQSIFIENANSVYSFTMQWDEPFRSVPGSQIGSASNLDVFFLVNGIVIARSTDNNIDRNAVEFLQVNPSTIAGVSGDTVEIEMIITLVEGPAPSFVKVISFNEAEFEFSASTGTSFGHPNAGRAAGVGSAVFANTPEFGRDPPLINANSSPGGIPIFFENSGSRLGAAVVRSQPRFVGPDGGRTTFFGNAPEFRFFGTSAAAPHAAAVAALMLEINDSLTPDEIYTILQETAIDMEDPNTSEFEVGFDFRTGHGLVNALEAVRRAEPITPGEPTIQPTAQPSSIPTVTSTDAPTTGDDEPTSQPTFEQAAISDVPSNSLSLAPTGSTLLPTNQATTVAPTSSTSFPTGSPMTFLPTAIPPTLQPTVTSTSIQLNLNNFLLTLLGTNINEEALRQSLIEYLLQELSKDFPDLLSISLDLVSFTELGPNQLALVEYSGLATFPENSVVSLKELLKAQTEALKHFSDVEAAIVAGGNDVRVVSIEVDHGSSSKGKSSNSTTMKSSKSGRGKGKAKGSSSRDSTSSKTGGNGSTNGGKGSINGGKGSNGLRI
jgi:hypothetical protein